ncbi:MAG: translocation/assembly module TamB domain-containing protein [Gammaproteobacteria bacterium]|nr:translocation/assembly module TamB domain-containing protein [Gammaproteobacteria bacterium]MBU1646645.1 translocation/assembly module TamB domain-containing protein [Gammaproteobacteria bacterium]MBU1972902.1 translocation/assembly module TamB domain-containing protein [Gammaproteobacteria bacterium]
MARLISRLAGRYFIRIALGLLLVAGAAAIALGTEAVLRWAAQQAAQASDGRLTLQGVSGSLFGPLQVEAATFQTGEQNIEVRSLHLDWTPVSLLRGHIHISRLQAQEVKIVELQPSTEPLALPQSLRLPVTLAAPAIRLDRVAIKTAGSEQILSDIDLGLELTAQAYQLQLRSLTTPWGKAQAALTLGDSRPFPVKATASLLQTGVLSYRAQADASGDLTQLLLKASAQALGGQVAINAKIAPFDSVPLLEARIEADKLNPAQLRRGLPDASLGATITVARRDKAAVDGNLTLRNATPGPLEKTRLPLREVAMRFGGDAKRIDLGAIRIDLGSAGIFTGDGRVSGSQLVLDLATQDFDPRGVHGKMRPMRLASTVHLQADPASQQLAAEFAYQRFRLQFDARRQDDLIEVRHATVKAGSGSLALAGSLDLAGKQPFQVTGTLAGFNPADFGEYPAARINASLAATGQIAATQATLEFTLADSHIRQQPLSGRGKLNLSPTRIWDSAIDLRLARNHVAANGALGNPGDNLTFRIDADNLTAIDPELAGELRAAGAIEGRFTAPSGSIEAEARNLSWRKQYRLASLSAKGKLAQGGDGPLAFDATLRGLATPQLRLDQASASAAGTRVRHTLQLRAGATGLDLAANLAGGWHEESGWAGQLTSLANRGRHAFTLKAPAKLEIARDRLVLRDARLDIASADLKLHTLDYDAGKLASRGEFTRLPLRYLAKFSERTADIDTNLMLGGSWQIAMTESVDGHLRVQREGGDIVIPTAPRTTLGLDRLELDITAKNSEVQGRMEAAGTRLGSLQAEAQSRLALRDGSWGIPGDAPLQARANLAIESLAWLQPIVDPRGALVFDGAVKASFLAGGSFAQPRMTGTLSGDRFAVALPEQGLDLKDGSFKAELRDQVLHLEKLSIRGGKGSLGGSGQLALKDGDPAMRLALTADKLEVLSRPDRHLVVSGSSETSVAGKSVKVMARLKADRGLIELPRLDAPTLSDDIQVLGRTTAAETKVQPYAASFELDLDLGPSFFLRGQGLDAQLGGTLKLAGSAGTLPSSRGSIRVVKGAYSAYGQHLEIERGILNFQGPLDNPGLNIVALRKNQPVEAGVAVTGTGQSPRVSLVSKPTVPDSEKLSWLVLGHGLDDSSGQEFSALQAAAGALLGAGESVTMQQKIAHAAGLEEVSFKGGSGLESTVLSLGKRLSSRAYLNYEQGLDGAGTLVKINYTLSRRLSVRAQAGAVPAVDLFYSFSFD